ncbi:peptide ABC transporter ATP-binding protein [Halobacteriales archaeon QH_8_64_26]|nr:MAG: peptide ABC transporter ATP-binding protein [Halobacteriales archaeon QH_8_64_26]
MSDDPLLSVQDLRKHYPITQGVLGREVGRVRAVDGISFDIDRGETLGLVGESGCGKSTAARTVLRLEEPTGGRIRFDGEDVGKHDRTARRRFRRRVGMSFQDPTSSFDPRMTVGESVAEPLAAHGLSDRGRRRDVAEDLIERVGLAAADYDRYPHEFSGGQKQRLALARALITNPDLLIADEPVSALDVSVQAEILALIADLQCDLGLSVVLISHDLSVVRELCDRVAVIYLGEIVETGPTEELFDAPRHPYTRALLASIPTPDPRNRGQSAGFSGDVPDPADPPSGCRFHSRCPAVIQPEGYEFDQERWRGVMDFRVAVRNRTVDLRALRQAARSRRGGAESTTVTDDGLRAAVREEYGLPGRLDDGDAEAVLTAAIGEVIGGEERAAEKRLEEAFETVCERRAPTRRETCARRSVACHLHDPAVDADLDRIDGQPAVRRADESR